MHLHSYFSKFCKQQIFRFFLRKTRTIRFHQTFLQTELLLGDESGRNNTSGNEFLLITP